MKLTFLIISVIFLTFVPSFSAGERIEWDETRPLVWSDFQEMPDVFPDTYEGPRENKAAFTWGYMTEMTPKFEKINSVICQYQITYVDSISEFSTQESWFKPDKVDKIVLEHEQGHFNIIEIHSRQYEKELIFGIFRCPNEMYNESEIKKNITSVFQKHLEQSRKHHLEYDAKTHENEFLIPSKQEYETNQINIELKDLYMRETDFSNKPIPKHTIGIGSEQKVCTFGWEVMKNFQVVNYIALLLQ